MKTITQFGGQNWLITPAALAFGEPPPTSIKDQKWLLTLTGVALVDLQPTSDGVWLREVLQILPDMNGPLNFAINRFSVPVPANPGYKVDGITKVTPFFQLEEWSPFAALGSIFDRNRGVDEGFAVDKWRPSPFITLTENGLPNITQVFQGIRVDAAVRGIGTVLHRVNYHISLLGKIVFAKPDPCQKQINNVKAAQNRIDNLTFEIETINEELRDENIKGKERARLLIRKKQIEEADLPSAKKELIAAQKALQVCTIRNSTNGDLDDGGVVNP